MTPIDEVIDLAFSLIHDTDLAKLAEEDLKHLAYNFLTFSIAKFKECKSDLTIEEKTILAYGVVYYWLQHKSNYNKLLKNAINTKDFQQLSNANLLLRLNEMTDNARKEFFRMRKAYSRRYDKFEGWS